MGGGTHVCGGMGSGKMKSRSYISVRRLFFIDYPHGPHANAAQMGSKSDAKPPVYYVLCDGTIPVESEKQMSELVRLGRVKPNKPTVGTLLTNRIYDIVVKAATSLAADVIGTAGQPTVGDGSNDDAEERCADVEKKLSQCGFVKLVETSGTKIALHHTGRLSFEELSGIRPSQQRCDATAVTTGEQAMIMKARDTTVPMKWFVDNGYTMMDLLRDFNRTDLPSLVDLVKKARLRPYHLGNRRFVTSNQLLSFIRTYRLTAEIMVTVMRVKTVDRLAAMRLRVSHLDAMSITRDTLRSAPWFINTHEKLARVIGKEDAATWGGYSGSYASVVRGTDEVDYATDVF